MSNFYICEQIGVCAYTFAFSAYKLVAYCGNKVVFCVSKLVLVHKNTYFVWTTGSGILKKKNVLSI